MSNQNQLQMLEVKSKYDTEFRRFGLDRLKINKFEEFYYLIEKLHGLYGIQFNICYTDKDGDLLPINNDNNLVRVLQVTMNILRLIILRKGECYPESGNLYLNGHYLQSSNLNFASSNLSYRHTNFLNQIKELSNTLTSNNTNSVKPFVISYPEDFRPVSAIIDVDILPDTYRRVRLHKHKSSKPLGFYIRDGRSLRVTPNGVEQVPGIFISRLVPGGLAESTGLLSVNDEVIEVNGIEVAGKTLDQVTDMMVANSSNLIITVKPTNQKYNLNRSQYNNTPKTNRTSNLNKSIQTSKKNDLFSKNVSCSVSTSSINTTVPSINKILNTQKDISLKAASKNSNFNWNIHESQITLEMKPNNKDLDTEKLYNEYVNDQCENEADEDDEEEICYNSENNRLNLSENDEKILTL